MSEEEDLRVAAVQVAALRALNLLASKLAARGCVELAEDLAHLCTYHIKRLAGETGVDIGDSLDFVENKDWN